MDPVIRENCSNPTDLSIYLSLSLSLCMSIWFSRYLTGWNCVIKHFIDAPNRPLRPLSLAPGGILGRTPRNLWSYAELPAYRAGSMGLIKKSEVKDKRVEDLRLFFFGFNPSSGRGFLKIRFLLILSEGELWRKKMMRYHGMLIVKLILDITLMQQNGMISIFSHTPQCIQPIQRLWCSFVCSANWTSAFCPRGVLLKRLADVCSSAAGYNL